MDYDTILAVGSADMTEFVECEAVSIEKSPVWSEEFTAVNGVQRKKCLGVSVSISADFKILTKEKLAELVSACGSDKVSVAYAAPNAETAEFDRPTYSISPVFEDGITSYWNVSVSMSCPLKGDGL